MTIQPGEGKAQEDIINICKYLKEGCKEVRARLEPTDGTSGSGHKLNHKRFHLKIRKHFTVNVN